MLIKQSTSQVKIFLKHFFWNFFQTWHKLIMSHIICYLYDVFPADNLTKLLKIIIIYYYKDSFGFRLLQF